MRRMPAEMALSVLLALLSGCASHEFRCGTKLQPINAATMTPAAAPTSKASTP